MERKRYKVSDVVRDRFYQMPKFLFEGELKGLSNDARVLYALLKDRHELSLKNQWINNKGEVYLIYAREDMQETLGLSENTVLKAVKQLRLYGLIQEERQGLGKPNLIYLVYHLEYEGFSRPAEFEVQDPQNLRFRPAEFEVHNPQNLRANDTDINDTENQSINRSIAHTEKPLQEQVKGLIDKIDEHTYDNDIYENYRELVKDNISYDALIHDNCIEADELDEIVDIVVETLCSKSDTIRVNKEDKPALVVKSQLLKLDYAHIQYVVGCLNENTTKIINIKAYLLSALYNAPSTISNYYRSAVNHDMYGGGDKANDGRR